MNTRIVLVTLACALAFGCDDVNANPDAGAVIILMDGARIDAGPARVDGGPDGRDAGSTSNRDGGRPDAGRMDGSSGSPDGGASSDAGADAGGTTVDAGSSCTVTGLMPLPAACLPRCRAATETAASMCADATCFFNTLDADPTAPITLTAGTVSGPLDCTGCVIWQRNVCWASSCPTEFRAAAGCDDTTDPDMCDGEFQALGNCVSTNTSAVSACANTLLPECFGT